MAREIQELRKWEDKLQKGHERRRKMPPEREECKRSLEENK